MKGYYAVFGLMMQMINNRIPYEDRLQIMNYTGLEGHIKMYRYISVFLYNLPWGQDNPILWRIYTILNDIDKIRTDYDRRVS